MIVTKDLDQFLFDLSAMTSEGVEMQCIIEKKNGSSGHNKGEKKTPIILYIA